MFQLYDNSFFVLSWNLLLQIHEAKDCLYVPRFNVWEGDYEFLCNKSELRKLFGEQKEE